MDGYMAYMRAALHELAQPRLTVPVLDASAIGISFVKRDVATAGQTMFLLNVGELLEDYTRAMSENELINSLLDVPDKAQKVVGDTEVSVAATELEPGDLEAVRTGMSICIDGVVEQGSAMVNQATLTGEPLAVERSAGDDVFAGTVVEDGSILVRVRANTAQTKLRSIVSLVQTADSLKSEGQSHMEDLANKIVPWNFLLAGWVALTTRSLIKTSAALMVDYSCALKLTGSVAVMTAMSDAAKMGVMVKGAKYFESFAKADTIVFDKTGTLTEAQPRLACVLTTDGWSEDEILRLSACLEEHFPHPVARAVVNAARERGLEHRERHAAVEYIVAHGIASSIEGRRAIIGSAHFVFEDEGAQLESDIKERIESRMQGLSPLYLAIVAFCFSMTVGVIWEFFECTMDQLFFLDMQKDTVVNTIGSIMLDPTGGNTPTVLKISTDVIVVQADGTQTALGLGGYLDIGLLDTMEDLFVNYIGAQTISLIGYFYVRSRGENRFAKRFIPVANHSTRPKDASSEAPEKNEIE